MNGEPVSRRALRDVFPVCVFAGLVLLPFLVLAIFARDARVEATGLDEVAMTITPDIAIADLPGAADDTVILSELESNDARARNAAIDFAAAGPGTASPFGFRGSEADRVRARDCLALAGMAEAGGGDADQRAVMQVILNRVRHPAFAGTVCGVVFEGSQRPTGCQFSFTCDGSLARRYSDAAWRAARERAEDMLGGATHAPVGNSTHFHADYVYPWWSDRLDKVAQVGPHIFFRWRGFWGSRAALSASYRGAEPDPLTLRQTALAVAEANPLPTLLQSGEAVRSITSQTPAQVSEVGQGAPPSPGAGVHFVLVARGESPQTLVERARGLCLGEGYCRVQGWSEADAIPRGLPLTDEARRAMRFSFVAAGAGGQEAIFLDCRTFPAPGIGTCLPARP
ncbi:cell wall hydrolase [Erythrobacter aureus]|uniref:cell wall hydrolase n=1 Tax=Erythrobacter aureus TaxID=2182384 RepID=UPI003A8DFCF5